jgi:hypothetical protein
MTSPTNPPVLAGTQLILSSYECMDRYYDLYFNIGDDGEVELWDTAPAGTTISLGVMWVSKAQVAAMEHAAQIKYDADVREANREARIARYDDPMDDPARRVRIAKKAGNPSEVFA